MQLGSQNAELHLYLGFELTRDGRNDEAVATLRRALEIRPQYVDAALLLGSLLLRQEQWPQAVLVLNRISKVETKREAYDLYRYLSYGYSRLNRLDDARKSAEKAKSFAEGPAETAQLDQFLAALENPVALAAAQQAAVRLTRNPAGSAGVAPPPGARSISAAPPEYSGRLVLVECSGEVATLHIEGDGETRRFAVRDPGQVVVMNRGRGDVEFRCGPQDRAPLRIEYQITGDADEVTLMEFLP